MSPKAPPRPRRLQPHLQPPAPPRRRVYAHIRSAEIACPSCGTMYLERKHAGRKQRYEQRTSLFSCGVCHRRYYLGVVFWPVVGRAPGRPADHVLTPGEALQLRLELSYAETRGAKAPQPTNVVCSCLEPCPVHEVSRAARRAEDEAAGDATVVQDTQDAPGDADPEDGQCQ